MGARAIPLCPWYKLWAQGTWAASSSGILVRHTSCSHTLFTYPPLRPMPLSQMGRGQGEFLLSWTVALRRSAQGRLGPLEGSIPVVQGQEPDR